MSTNILSEEEIDDWITTLATYDIAGHKLQGRAQIHEFARRIERAVIEKTGAGELRTDNDPLSDFQEGQWWIKELDGMVSSGTLTHDQVRAIAVVHHMLRAASDTSAVIAKRYQQGYEAARAEFGPDNLEAAAQTLADLMDYPWDHMPEQGRQNMRKNAECVLKAGRQSTEQES